MRIGVVGLGYVGLVTAAVLSNKGNKVVGVDVAKERVKMLKEGQIPIFEPGLANKIEESGQNLKFSSNYSDLSECDAIFLCVPTPNIKGKIDLNYVFEAAKNVSKYSHSSSLIIKSTVLPGTAKRISEITEMNVISNPEFTREGSAIYDTEHPNRIVIGGKSVEIAKEIWEFTGSHLLITTNENAELIKYASNAFLSVKISFINQIADLCERIPRTDVDVVAKGMGLDHRIGAEFLKAGLGYGGSCLPKDTVALLTFASENGIKLSIIKSAVEYNKNRVHDLVERIVEDVGTLKGKRVCVLGLSFKDNTDDLRESRSLLLIEELRKLGAIVHSYDPVVRRVKNFEISRDIEGCLSSSEIVITATEWKDFSNIAQSLLQGKEVFDLRRVFDPKVINLTMGVGIGKD